MVVLPEPLLELPAGTLVDVRGAGPLDDAGESTIPIGLLPFPLIRIAERFAGGAESVSCREIKLHGYHSRSKGRSFYDRYSRQRRRAREIEVRANPNGIQCRPLSFQHALGSSSPSEPTCYDPVDIGPRTTDCLHERGTMGVTLADLVERFDSGEIRLPLMQRDYVWKPKKVVRLLDSLYRGWPIGSFYVWQTTSDRPSRRRVGKVHSRHLDSFFGFLLDGQQRLTSLSLGLKGDADGELAQRAFFDIENQQFYLGEMTKTVTKRIQAGDPLLVPLADIVVLGRDDGDLHKSIERIVQALREQSKLGKNPQKEVDYRERLHRLANMLRREALCEEFPDEQEEHAFELFSRLNRGGTSLSAGDVEAARLASAATRGIVEPMRALSGERDMRTLGINFVFLLRVLVTVHRGNSSFSKLPRNWADDKGEVEASWKRTEQALRATVRFVRTEVGWTTRRWLPSTMALIPVVYLLAKGGNGDLKGKDAEYVKGTF